MGPCSGRVRLWSSVEQSASKDVANALVDDASKTMGACL